ncbi:Ca2+-ATPase amino-terminal autoinhibitory domain protein, putative [Medicago truncatula]|uniref:Ca2+-ATPase amino-terminal autoinhibitory domain protein, putative n=1 Tax=Medicago truncatula TaxID=3880 RepID=A0A072U8G3_MEDTR|nr:Ca2+-ATPase amino-terminal autoinhibitory domain protein, putative [Medicago truncatula]
MRLDGFLRRTVFCPSLHSSLAIASNEPRLASDEVHRSPREPKPFASRVTCRSSPQRATLLAIASMTREHVIVLSVQFAVVSSLASLSRLGRSDTNFYIGKTGCYNNNHHPSDNNNRRDDNDNNGDNDEDDEQIDPDDPFHIAQTKNASHETLRRWRVISFSYSHF